MAVIMKFTKFALKNLFSKPVTKNYPMQPREYPERTRGSVQINIDDCLFCGMCAKRCPSGAITVDRAERTWSIDRMGCVQCENCVNTCPKKCLHTDVMYTEPGYDKKTDTFRGAPPPPKPAMDPEKLAALKAAAAAKKAAAAKAAQTKE
ncbi:MAG: 4Fe-4S dicluster domain-containing protein [Clostridiales bacterium]|nr:4Fe-4S dicluster domain-containing protein [Clostridiales bacterium]